MAQPLRIGKAAKATGLTVDTIRFYQKAGLLKPPARSAGGYRVFTGIEIDELQFIRKAQDLGFSLAEIKELMHLRGQNGQACPEVREIIKRRLATVRAKINALQHLEAELGQALRTCSRAIRAGAHGEPCPVIEQIQSTKKRSRHDH